jgi:hypothetical protein
MENENSTFNESEKNKHLANRIMKDTLIYCKQMGMLYAEVSLNVNTKISKVSFDVSAKNMYEFNP